MYERGLTKRELSNNQCFFYQDGTLYKNSSIAKYHNREKRKTLVGRYYNSYWHYGVSAQVRLSPLLCFSLKSHILFSDDGLNIWSDDSKLHAARRSKGKRWFNEEWRDLLMAFLSSLSKGRDKVEMTLSEDFILEMFLLTEEFYSAVGYDEPETKERLNILHESDESLYEIDDLTSGFEDQQLDQGGAIDD
jgi:hypothetical protein